ncbi:MULTISPECIES: Clp protease ClpP [Marispirochaeta]|uniref:Clp protease ClpP n=1 Tax=Marispirochaeta TaxID=1911565 RepID=UPI0029C83FBC|nr:MULTISPECIES: Clp protease ClpP [Marispirochaeta]
MMYTIDFSGVIGEDLTAAWLKTELKNAGGQPVRIDFNSPGGSIFTGREMGQALRDYPGTITARIVSIAASMASYLTTLCDRVTVGPDSVYMAHYCSGLTAGGARDHERAVEILRGIDDQLVRGYVQKTGQAESVVRAWMEEEKYFFGKEIEEVGFADKYLADDRATALDRSTAIARAQHQVAACVHPPTPAEIAALAKEPVRLPLSALWERPELFQSKDDPAGIMTIKH